MGAVNPHQALDFFAELRAKGQVDDRSYCAVLEVFTDTRRTAYISMCLTGMRVSLGSVSGS
jgi:hypothetical protein